MFSIGTFLNRFRSTTRDIKHVLATVLRLAAIVLCLLMVGCQTTESYYMGSYKSWSNWKERGTQSRTISITSEPSGASIYVDGRYRGRTPGRISLDYPLLQRTRTRDQKRKYLSGGENLVNDLVSIASFDTIRVYNRPHVQKVGQEEQRETKSGSAKYTITIRKDGYLPKSMRIEVSSGRPSTKHFLLSKKPSIAVSQFHLTKAIDQGSGVAQFLWDHVFSNEKRISKGDYPRIGKEMARVLAECLSDEQKDIFNAVPGVIEVNFKKKNFKESRLKAASKQGVEILTCGEVEIGKEGIKVKTILISVGSGKIIMVDRRSVRKSDFPGSIASLMSATASGLANRYRTNL